jgi:hypothetical protein
LNIFEVYKKIYKPLANVISTAPHIKKIHTYAWINSSPYRQIAKVETPGATFSRTIAKVAVNEKNCQFIVKKDKEKKKKKKKKKTLKSMTRSSKKTKLSNEHTVSDVGSNLILGNDIRVSQIVVSLELGLRVLQGQFHSEQ